MRRLERSSGSSARSRRSPHSFLPLSWLGLACGMACGSGGVAKPAAVPSKRTPGAAKPAAISGATAERVRQVWEAAAGGYGRAVAVSRRHGRVAYASKTHVALYDLGTGKLLGEARPCTEVVHTGLAFVGAKLHLVCTDQLVSYAADRLAPVAPPAIDKETVTAAAFAGARLALGHHDGVVRVYDLEQGKTTEVPVPGPPIDVKSLALSADGKRLAVAWVQGSVWWWELSAPDQFHKLVRQEAESDALAFDPSGQLLAEEGARHTTSLWRLTEATAPYAKLQGGEWTKQILFSPDAKWLVRGGSDGLHLAEIGGSRRVALDARGKVEDVAIDENFATLAVAEREGRLSVWAVR
ncbi:MAG: hypothetical protein R3B13_01595 [Polyangiaceae bacterium]